MKSKKFPSFSQWKQIFKILKKAERKVSPKEIKWRCKSSLVMLNILL